MELARVAVKQKDYKGALGYLAHARTLEPGGRRRALSCSGWSASS